MTTVSISGWNAQGVIPPLHSDAPTEDAAVMARLDIMRQENNES